MQTQNSPPNFKSAVSKQDLQYFPLMRAIMEAILLTSQSGQMMTGRRSHKLPTKIDSEHLEASTYQNLAEQKYLIPTLKELPITQLGSQQAFMRVINKILSSNFRLEPFLRQEYFLDFLFKIEGQILSQGGIVQLGSIGCFEKFYYCFIEREGGRFKGLKRFESAEIELIRQVLFSYEFLARNQQYEMKLYEIGLINFVGWQELKDKRFDKQWGLHYFHHDLTLFQEGAKGIQVDCSVFSIKPMINRYGHEEIDIRVQNPHDYGFNARKLTNKAYRMPLRDYQFYQENYQNPTAMQQFPHLHILGRGQILFGVNFEPADNFLNHSIKQNVGNTFLDFHSSIDLLSYLDEDVPGCSSPQLYFKTLGCWTGGHQENVCMSALNINHGPSYSEWYTLDLKYVPRLRKQLIDHFGMDLIIDEGLWYQQLDWFIKQGYPVKRFLQRKDDIVVTGPGTLHWVRSFGVAMQTSWNIFPKLYHQFQTAFRRQENNQQVKFSKSSTIPLKSLTIKYLNHQLLIMDPFIRKLCTQKLEIWLEYERHLLHKLDTQRRQINYLTDLASFCSLCYQEILLFYTFSKGESLVCCLGCCDEKKDKHSRQIFLKYREQDLAALISRCRSQQGGDEEVEGLCGGKFVGEIAGCRKQGKVGSAGYEHEMMQKTGFKDQRNSKVPISSFKRISKQKNKAKTKTMKVERKQGGKRLRTKEWTSSDLKSIDQSFEDERKETIEMPSEQKSQLLPCQSRKIQRQHQESQTDQIFIGNQTKQQCLSFVSCQSLTILAPSQTKRINEPLQTESIIASQGQQLRQSSKEINENADQLSN